jgi:hypothetical protein
MIGEKNMYEICFLGNFTTSWDTSVAFERYIADSFESIGHKVHRVQRETWRDNLPEDVDFILIAQWNGYGEDIVEVLKNKYNKPIIYWAFDYHYVTLEQWHIELASKADLFLSKEMKHREFYKSKGANFHWFCEDFAPDFYKMVVQQPKEYDVVFMGSHLPWAKERSDLIKAIDQKFKLDVFTYTVDGWKGEGIKNVHPIVYDQDLPDLISKTKINIAIDHINSEGYWSDRVARIMCLGGFVLNRYVPLQESIFKNYITYFKNIDECLKKINYYLINNEEREQIADGGQFYAISNLKAVDRVKELITIYENLLR